MASHTVAKLKLPTSPLGGHAHEFHGFLFAEPPVPASRPTRSLGLVRGIRFAILGEIVAGLCAYGVWRMFWG